MFVCWGEMKILVCTQREKKYVNECDDVGDFDVCSVDDD